MPVASEIRNAANSEVQSSLRSTFVVIHLTPCNSPLAPWRLSNWPLFPAESVYSRIGQFQVFHILRSSNREADVRFLSPPVLTYLNRVIKIVVKTLLTTTFLLGFDRVI